MNQRIYNAVYLSIFIATVRRLVAKFKPRDGRKAAYAVVIPFCGECILCGRYLTEGDALAARVEFDHASGYKCKAIKSSELRGYIANNCSGRCFTLFDQPAREYFIDGKLRRLQSMVRRMAYSEV